MVNFGKKLQKRDKYYRIANLAVQVKPPDPPVDLVPKRPRVARGKMKELSKLDGLAWLFYFVPARKGDSLRISMNERT